MKVRNHMGFSSQFPENFNWNLTDSISLGLLAVQLAARVQYELKETNDRLNVPGLRFALNKIAEQAEIN